jgi:hypothetical protein
VFVAVISSNVAEPFWAKFVDRQQHYMSDLEAALDRIVREIVEQKEPRAGKNGQKRLTMKAER